MDMPTDRNRHSISYSFTPQENQMSNSNGLNSSYSSMPTGFPPHGQSNFSRMNTSSNAMNSSHMQSVSQPAPSGQLPPNWNQLNSADRSGMIYQMLCSLSDEHRQFREILADNTRRIVALEAERETADAYFASELNQLKDLHRRGNPTAELKVSGIPAGLSDKYGVITTKLLEILNVANLKDDILDVREFKPKAAEQRPSVSSENNTVADGNKFVTIAVKFKSHEISQHVLNAKRKHGEVKFSAIHSDDKSENIVTVYEILPPYWNNLRLKARAIANQKGYKHVWPSYCTILVKKTDKSTPIVISTEQDLGEIV